MNEEQEKNVVSIIELMSNEELAFTIEKAIDELNARKANEEIQELD